MSTMQLGVGKTVFPSWAAAVTLVKDHGVNAVQHATSAIKGSGAERLDQAVLAMTSFDHAIDNTRKLPVSWFVKSLPMYYRGYEAAKQAVTLLVASGLIPGAKERVGRQSLAAAKETFLAGVQVARGDRTRFGGHLASGWLEATAEDALTGVAMLQQGTDAGRALLSGISQVRTAVARRNGVDELLVKTVTELFDRTAGFLDAAIAAKSATQGIGTTDPAAYQRSEALLEQVAAAAKQLVQDTPDVSELEQMPAA
jgi:hypothetical protein